MNKEDIYMPDKRAKKISTRNLPDACGRCCG